jgi:conjugative relaxase-like TrwC/TraI family protein
MTVRVTTLKGPLAGVYYVEQLPSYYLQAGEPRGLWLGCGAWMLGLDGDVHDEAFLAVMGGVDPRQPSRLLGRRYDERSVRGFDVTCSAPKSVSVLWALGDEATRRQVVEAHDAAVAALAGWVEGHVHTRFRIAGEVAVVDAEGIVAAAFRQHTSRAGDPQLHTHLVIANRVRSPDGRWLALDARTIKMDQRTLSALYHVGLRAELTRRLGVRWDVPEHGIAEIADIPEELRVEFSRRTGEVQRRVDEKLDRFAATMGREPTPQERWRLEREAVVDSRPAKPKALDAEVLHRHWVDQVVALGLAPVEVVELTVGRVGRDGGIDGRAAGTVVDRAMAVIGEGQSSWRPAELVRELAAPVPTANAVEADRLIDWLDNTAHSVEVSRCVDLSRPIPPGVLLRRDGRPVTESAIDRAFTTQAILDQEAGLLAWADRRLVHVGGQNPDAVWRAAPPLTGGQAETAAAIAGWDDLVLVVGPAGTGKTTALTPAVEQLRADGRAVFGVARSATAADVLALETGVAADTVDKLLVEHRLGRPPDHRYDLPVGATVIVDEAGMIPTARLAELADLADLRGWRVALVGDPLQFSAVGRGGMFGLLVDTYTAVELDRVHRFHQPWERDASLRLRHGDVDVVDLYDEHGRLDGGTPDTIERAAVAAWWSHRHTGETVLLMAPTTETVDRLNVLAQQLRIRAGELDATGRSVEVGSAHIYVGDGIATRRNDRHLLTDRGEMVRNRASWTVAGIHPDGSLTATGRHGTVRLPHGYVADHVELAYACTAAAAQGRTVDHGLVVVDRPCDVRNLYVAMSRGTHSNHAYLATPGETTAHDVFTHCLIADWIDQPAHTRRAELQAQPPHRAGLLDGPVLRDLLERRHQLAEELQQAEAREQRLPGELRQAEAARTAAEEAIAGLQAEQLRLEDFIADYDRPLRRRRHQGELLSARDHLAGIPHRLDTARDELTSANDTVARLNASAIENRAVLARRGDNAAKIADLDDQLADDLRTRTRVARREQPESIVTILGPRPRHGHDAQSWDTAAGRLAQHQAAFTITDGLGPRPDYYDRSPYRNSHQAVAELLQPLELPVFHHTIERPDLGLSL